MKYSITLLLLSVCSFLYSQTKTFENIKNMNRHAVGAFVDENSVSTGYFVMFEDDKLKGGDRKYNLEILDTDFNTIASKNLILDKKSLMVDGLFNGETFAITYVEEREERIVMNIYDKEANLIRTRQIPIEKKDAKNYYNTYKDISSFAGSLDVFPVRGSGFIITRKKNFSGLTSQKYDSEAIFIPHDKSKKGFTLNLSNDENKREFIQILNSNENYIVLNKGVADSKKNHRSSILVYDSKTGKKLFDYSLQNQNSPKVVLGSFFTKSGLIGITGEHFQAGVNPFKEKSEGIFFMAFDGSGNQTFSKELTWEQDIHPKLSQSQKSKSKEYGYLFFHDFINAGSKYYVVTEAFKETVSAGKVIGNVLGGLGGNINGDVSQLTIDDAVILQFDSGFNIEGVQVLEKDIRRWQGAYTTASPQLNAQLANAYGQFDYKYSQLNQDQSKAYINFLNYDKRKGERNGYTLEVISVDDNGVVKDNVQVNSKVEWFEVFPAEFGVVTVGEFERKDKALTLRKVNLN